jgi:pyridoxamine 5'-phosphate oxidase
MTDTLFAAAPGFDQPIAVLKHCHGRIRKQLATLRKLVDHLPESGADIEAQQAAYAVLRYFNEAAPLHHEDEEVDLLPLLEATAKDLDAGVLQELMPRILQEHQQMEAAWKLLDRQLSAIASGQATSLSTADVDRFATLYDAHMQLEESAIAPMALRLFTAEQIAALGAAMRARRGLSQ